MLPLFVLFAQDAPKPGPMGMELLLIPVLLLLFYFVVIRPAQKKQEQEAADKLNSLQKDDEVLTIGGIYGTVVSVSADKDKDEIVVKISDNTRVKMTRAAIHRNMTHEERLKAKATDKSKDTPPTDAQASAGQIRKA